MADSGENPDFQDLQREAREWVIWIRSGEATAEDTAALLRWRARSADHAAALSEAIRLRRLVAIAGQDEPLPPAKWSLPFMPLRAGQYAGRGRSEEHTSELQSLMRIPYAVFCLQKKTVNNSQTS